MADTFNKKALQQKRAKKKQDKLEKKEDRKANNDKGKSLDDMIVYLDENGNFTNIPPDKQKKPKNKVDNFVPNTVNNSEDVIYFGKLALFFSEKNYGFITEEQSQSSIFVHSNQLGSNINVNDKVSFIIENTPKGKAAKTVKKVN